MKLRLVFSLAILALGIIKVASDSDQISTSSKLFGTLPLERVHVTLTNQIAGKDLYCHCHSKDDLGEQKIASGTAYNFDFKVDFFGTTSFKCQMWWFNDHGAKMLGTDIVIYNYDRDQQGCGSKNNCVRVAKNDGLYFDKNLQYGWTATN
ncbi:hypothetical protein ACHQM5_024920 [Ranunculus cassubicifolius]